MSKTETVNLALIYAKSMLITCIVKILSSDAEAVTLVMFAEVIALAIAVALPAGIFTAYPLTNIVVGLVTLQVV